MKIEVIREKLQTAVQKAQRLSSKHLSLPILSNVLLVAKHGSLLVRATNLDMGCEYLLPAKVEREGALAVPAGVFSAFVSNLSGAHSVILEGDTDKLIVSGEGARAVINGAKSDDFHTIPKPEGSFFALDPQSLLKGLRSVYYAGALGNLKHELSSVYLCADGEELVFAATDSFRLAEKRIQFKKASVAFPPMLLPIKNVVEIIRLLEEEKNEVRTFAGNGQFSIEGNGLLFTSRLIEGVFPDYKQIIPKEFAAEAIALREDVLSALKLISLFSDRFNQMTVRMDQKKKLIEISARSGEFGEGKSSIHAALTGESAQSNFNYRYITDCLPSISSDSVVFRWTGEGRPLLLGGVGDKSFRYLVMPMNR